MVSGSDIHDHNTFDTPDMVNETSFTAYTVSGGEMKVTLPAHSVVEIRVKKN